MISRIVKGRRMAVPGLVAPAAVALVLAPLWLGAPAGAEDFTFRRVPVATTQPGRRITVQIDPEEQARRIAPPAAPAAAPAVAPSDRGPRAPVASRLAWFWERVSPERAQSRGRFLQAMAALDTPPDGGAAPAPSLQTLSRIARAHNAEILGATAGTRVSPALALAVIVVESAGRPRAVSHAGAQGLMQLIPATAERFGVADAFDPAQNIRGGVTYLDWLLERFDGDVVLALAGYNAGEGAVQRHDGVPPFAETRDYVPKVLAAWRVARGLCRTRPELPGDPCVFVLPDAQVASASGG